MSSVARQYGVATSRTAAAYYDADNPYARWLQSNDVMASYSSGKYLKIEFFYARCIALHFALLLRVVAVLVVMVVVIVCECVSVNIPELSEFLLIGLPQQTFKK